MFMFFILKLIARYKKHHSQKESPAMSVVKTFIDVQFEYNVDRPCNQYNTPNNIDKMLNITIISFIVNAAKSKQCCKSNETEQ